MAKADNITADEAEQAAKRLPKFNAEKAESTYGGQKGHVLTMVKSELLKLKDENGDPLSPRTRSTAAACGSPRRSPRRRWTPPRRASTRSAPTGPASTRSCTSASASVQVDTGAVRGIYGGQDYLESQINWAVAGGMAGSSLKPFALTAGIKAGFSLKDTFDGNSPFELPDGTGEVENQGDESYGSAVNLIKATEDSINTAFVDLTTSMHDGPQKVMETMNAMGIPPRRRRARTPTASPTTRRVSSRSPASRSAPRR